MIRHVLCKRFFFTNEDIKFSKNDEGKPYIKGCPIHFNVSHAAEFVVCAFSEQVVGIDIEQIKEVDLQIAKRFFCQCEYEDLLAQKMSDRLDYFYSLWTLKESYIKWLGTGMSTPLDSFCFNVTDAGISFLDYNRKISPFFKQFFIEGYKLSICSMIPDLPDEIEKISIEEMTF
jgi:4'-phosphopantetheinyl transferase